MPVLRSQLKGIEKRDGRETVLITVRAASEIGAIATARLAAARNIPIRDQKIFAVASKSNHRFLNPWEVSIQDRQEFK